MPKRENKVSGTRETHTKFPNLYTAVLKVSLSLSVATGIHVKQCSAPRTP